MEATAAAAAAAAATAAATAAADLPVDEGKGIEEGIKQTLSSHLRIIITPPSPPLVHPECIDLTKGEDCKKDGGAERKNEQIDVNKEACKKIIWGKKKKERSLRI
jgi:hypothetical protein